MWRRITLLLLLAGLAPAHPARAADPPAVIVYDLELYDTSGIPALPEQDARLHWLAAEMRESLAASGRYRVIPAPPLPDGPCNGCELTAAQQQGADLVMTGLVHKVSNLILKMTLTLREVPSGTVRGSWTADFRNNTDESWQRAMRWLLRNRILVATDREGAPR
ncbi:DUF3280 domain-containing protein [Roseomonas marmotae]|uniref:DUF3280 domain-containing protein n=1 Tax=Roseomonas marmotae TaxID=2768161 RepID=A0ABS3KFW7_9PROT|nr:DUF3280 domain-containing protein [Roseomonas marmotae]MBO1075543.1 DUF3280 domain-containing protein [Roseomonas marmotae]QTI81534.1 DUF3280 domain-containing protein [Roseomonas marmotae]